MDAELNSFKSNISLVETAQKYGFEIDKKDSYRNCLIMRRQSDDGKISVTRKEDGHDLFYDFRASAGGSVIDFVAREIGDNNPKLVKVRQALRTPKGQRPAPGTPAKPSIRPAIASKDHSAVIDRHLKMKPYAGSYLTQKRGLDPAVIKAFGVREDERGDAVFAHYNADGVCGYEVKGAPRKGETKTYTSFASGGSVALHSKQFGPTEDVKKIVITEAAIDALSYAQLHGHANTVFISTAGSNLSSAQLTQLKTGFARFPGAQIIVASDNDALNPKHKDKPKAEQPGEKMAAQIATVAPAGQQLTRHTPHGQDFNADLRAHQAAQERQAAQLMNTQQQRHRGSSHTP